jgi:hypothetical protein
MPPRRRTDPGLGRAALAAWRADPDGVDRASVATAVRYTLEELGARAPGRSVEVRVPPFGAVQCVEGPRHTRGTPPNVVESDAETWLRLATGEQPWGQALAEGRLRVSGTRAHLDALLPLTDLASAESPAPAKPPQPDDVNEAAGPTDPADPAHPAGPADGTQPAGPALSTGLTESTSPADSAEAAR